MAFTQKKYSFIFVILFCVIATSLISREVYKNKFCNKNNLEEQLQQIRLYEGGFKLINPLLACDTASNNDYYELKDLKSKLENLIANQKNHGLAERISVYYRSLNDGHWTGVDENEKYIPASLVKVPLLIAYMKKAETNPEILDKQYVYNEENKDDMQAIENPSIPFIMGKSYSVRELLFRMIVYSGNNSQKILAENMDKDFLMEVYTDLGISYSDVNEPTGFKNTISPKTFATFLRILYNASYLSKDYSEKALETMTESTFKSGLASGLPENIKIAHKFGERTILYGNTDKALRELHDCGIVYDLLNPYLLCVMTQGDDFNDLKTVLSQISEFIYSEIDKL